MAGFAENSAPNGGMVTVRAFGMASLFSGLVPGIQYFVRKLPQVSTWLLVQFSSVPSLSYTRLVLDAQTATMGIVVDGPIIQRP